jgi:hypothetical protein
LLFNGLLLTRRLGIRRLLLERVLGCRGLLLNRVLRVLGGREFSSCFYD